MIKKTAYAKLDLAIHINPHKSNSDHYPVHYIDCQIDLCDKLFFEQQEKNIEIICDDPMMPENEDNFVYKTALLLKEIADNKKLGAKITLEKNIPIKAGFGGGSSDAATTLLALSKLWNIKLNENQILDLSKTLGKDFYYSLHGKLSEVQAEGGNYKVSPLACNLLPFLLLVVVPFEEKPSTGWVYEHLQTKTVGKNFDKIDKLKKAIYQNNKETILKNLTNDFENSVSSFYPVIKKMKSDLSKVGSLGEIMAGAGLAVVGFFNNKEKAENAKWQLTGKYKRVLIAKPV